MSDIKRGWIEHKGRIYFAVLEFRVGSWCTNIANLRSPVGYDEKEIYGSYDEARREAIIKYLKAIDLFSGRIQKLTIQEQCRRNDNA